MGWNGTWERGNLSQEGGTSGGKRTPRPNLWKLAKRENTMVASNLAKQFAGELEHTDINTINEGKGS